MKNCTTLTERFTLPSHWSSYLINHDSSGISDEDRKQADDFVARVDDREYKDNGGCLFPLDIEGEEYFAHRNDADDVPGMVCTYIFEKGPLG